MNSDLFDQLEGRVESLLTALGELKRENDRLRQENDRLTGEREALKSRIDTVLRKLEEV